MKKLLCALLCLATFMSFGQKTSGLKDAQIGQITEGGKKLSNSDDFKNIKAEGKAVKVDIGSGLYVFEWVSE